MRVFAKTVTNDNTITIASYIVKNSKIIFTLVECNTNGIIRLVAVMDYTLDHR